MPWCPKCKIEYREGFKTCADCGSALVDQLAPEDEAETKFDTELFLVTVDGEEQAIVVESLLHSFNIPTARNYKEAGSYVRVITGTSAFGIDIYVPSHNLDEARKILKTTAVAHPEAEQEPVRPRRKRHDYHKKRRRIARWIMLVAFAMALAVSVLITVSR